MRARSIGPVSPLTIASDRALEELTRALRAELMHEFRIAPPPVRRWSTLGLHETPRSKDMRERERGPFTLELGANTHSVARVVRLCIDPTTPNLNAWSVVGMKIGVQPLTIGPEPIAASAFAPLPKWITETPPELEKVPELVRALEAFPIANVPPTTASPGLVVSVELSGPRDASAPRAWFLCEVPSDDFEIAATLGPAFRTFG